MPRGKEKTAKEIAELYTTVEFLEKERELLNEINEQKQELAKAQARAKIEKIKQELTKELAEIKDENKAQKTALTKELNKVKKQIKWHEFYSTSYGYKDHTNSLAYQMFGKRLKDLTDEEKAEYNKITTQQSRERKKEQKQMKEKTRAYELAKYLYDNYAKYNKTVYFDTEYSFVDAKNEFYYDITKKDFEKAIQWLRELSLPLYDGFLELNSNHTFWQLNTTADEGTIFAILDEKLKEFEKQSKAKLFTLGRSGRHICVDSTFENAVKYYELKELQEKLEDEFIEEINNLQA